MSILLATEQSAAYDAAMINAAQIRAARALLDWTQLELAMQSGLAVATIKKLESGRDSKASTLQAVQAAFEKSGVIVLEPGDARSGGRGVRFSSEG